MPRAGSIPFANARTHSLALAVAAAVLLAVFDNGRIDLAIASAIYDRASGGFPMQNAWLFDSVLHHGLKSALVALLLATLVLCFLAGNARFPWLPPRRALGLALALVLIPLLTTALKSLTNRHCPWSMEVFGGFAPYVGLLDSPPADIVRGQCFPAGHASGGFAWISAGFALWDSQPFWAKRLLWGGLALGGVMGLGRMLQGAHFLSHVLWSAWLAWAVSLAVTTLVVHRRPLRRGADSA